jgi:hypothetical protein
VASALAKMQAESVLCANLTVAWLLLPILPGANKARGRLCTDWWHWMIFAMVFVGLCVIANIRYIMWRGRQFVIYTEISEIEAKMVKGQ